MPQIPHRFICFGPSAVHPSPLNRKPFPYHSKHFLEMRWWSDDQQDHSRRKHELITAFNEFTKKSSRAILAPMSFPPNQKKHQKRVQPFCCWSRPMIDIDIPRSIRPPSPTRSTTDLAPIGQGRALRKLNLRVVAPFFSEPKSPPQKTT